MIINEDIYLKMYPKLIRKGKQKNVDEYFIFYESDDFIDEIINWIDLYTGYKITFPDDLEDDYISKLNYIMFEIQNLELEEKKLISTDLKMYISDVFNAILLGADPEVFNKGKYEDYEDNLDLYDYSGLNNFWQVTVDNNEIVMSMCSNHNIEKRYNTEAEMKKDFIKLSTFLKKSTFIGKEFIRTKPMTLSNGKEDKSFMAPTFGGKYIVLFATQELFLAKRTGFVGHQDSYVLIEQRYISDGNYKFVGKTYNEYRDINKVYSEIKEQIRTSFEKQKRNR